MNHTKFVDWVTIWLVHFPKQTKSDRPNYRITPDYAVIAGFHLILTFAQTNDITLGYVHFTISKSAL